MNNIEYVYNIHRSEATYLKNVKTSCVKSLLKIHCASWGEGGGGEIPMMAHTGGSARKGYLQFRLQVYERVGISLVVSLF